MLRLPSISVVISGIFLGYILYSVWTLVQLFKPPNCQPGEKCISSFLRGKPNLQLLLYVSTKPNPTGVDDVTLVFTEQDFKYNSSLERRILLSLPYEVRHNGSLFMHLFLQANQQKDWKFWEILHEPTTAYLKTRLTQYHVPQAATFQLLGSEKQIPKRGNKEQRNKDQDKPVTHLRSRITFNIMNEDLLLPQFRIPGEMIRLFTLTSKRQYLPVVQYDFLNNRIKDLVQITANHTSANFTLLYSPISFGKLRLVQHVRTSLQTFKKFGFTDKDVDEVKGIFSDTNIYLLSVTVFVSAMHLVFDFLAFKNDVSFWRNTQNLVGLSSRTIIWRAFSQAIIFFYLLDENTSLLVLIPSGIGVWIELWKLGKVMKLDITSNYPWCKVTFKGTTKAEQETQQFDAESMRYLSYVLYPLCIGGAVYSLLYEPHKSWYSWTIHSLVNGVYAFGFLFMLPQLFVNYKLKSVAHLPWKAFMYKAFNTFIDDLFAFIITMPTAHRLACFRDDVVFVLYLYQRWLYPVDKSRRDEMAPMEDTDHKKQD